MQILNSVAAIYITAVAFFILIFPIFIREEAFFDKKTPKLYFSLSLYGVLKLIGGYAQIIKEGIILHISDKKAIILPFSALDMRQEFSLAKDYSIYSFGLLTELGSEEVATAPFAVAIFENTISKIAFSVASSLKSHVRLESDVLLYEDDSVLKFSQHITIAFNILTVLITLFKIFMGKILNGKGK